MDDQQKLDAVIEVLTESHLPDYGGYPYDYSWIDDKNDNDLVIAALDPAKDMNRTEVQLYNSDKLVDWFDRAAQFAVEDGKEEKDAVEYLYEVGYDEE